MAALLGMKEITEYVRRSDATVLALIRDFDFPAVKLVGIWESTTESIDEWRRRMVEGAGDAPASVEKPLRGKRR